MAAVTQTTLTGLKRPLDSDSANAAPPPKKRAAPKKSALSALGHCSLSKKDFGDKIKSCLSLEKYAIQRMSFEVEMDVSFFRAFFDGVQIVPEAYDESTPVVVATLNNASAGKIFGVSKIKNGNRYTQYDLRTMAVILYPATKKAQVFLSV